MCYYFIRKCKPRKHDRGTRGKKQRKQRGSMRPAATRWGWCWLLCTLVSGKGKFYPSTCAGSEYDPRWEQAVEGTGVCLRQGTIGLYPPAVRVHAELLARDAARTRKGWSRKRSEVTHTRSDASEHRMLGFPKLCDHGVIFLMSIQLTCQRGLTFLTMV